MKAICKSIVVRLLTWEAAHMLRRHKPTVIAITGSVGKTATKDAVYQVLRASHKVRKSEKSFNSEVGIPLTILGLPNAWSNPWQWFRNLVAGAFLALFSRDYPEVLVIEAGVDRPGDMQQLTQWFRPDYVIVTRLPDVPVHVEHFGSPEEVVQEKMVLAEALASDGVFIYNHDDAILQEEVKQVRQKHIGYARYAHASYLIQDDQTTYDEQGIATGFRFTLQTPQDTSYTITGTGTIGMQLAYVYTAAAVVGEQFGVSAEEIAVQLADHTPPPGRMRVFPGIKETTLIDDTYNSSPVAVESALHTLNELQVQGRKIAVLGDMLELGSYSVEQHTRIGILAAQLTDALYAVGVRSRGTAQAALEHGLPEEVIFQYDSVERAGKELQQWLEPGDVVLIKGSQSIRMERIVEEVMLQPDQASQLLVRQSKEWLRR